VVTLIVEPNPHGHHLAAAGDVARVALREGSEVVLLSRARVQERDEFAVHMSGLPIAVREPFGEDLPSTRQLVDEVFSAAREVGADHIVLMDADDALRSWWFRAFLPLRRLPTRPRVTAFLTRWPHADWSLRPENRYFVKIRAAKTLLVFAAKFTGTMSHVAGFSSRDVQSVGWPVRNAIDPADCLAHSRDRDTLRQRYGLPADRRLAGIFGGIGVRKDVPLAFAAVLEAGDDWDLLLAGPVSDEVPAWLEALPSDQRKRIIVRDGILADEDLDSMLAASDAVVLLMWLEGPSGIMGKALVADVPVLTARSRSRERELEALHRGVATTDTPEALAAGLRQIADLPRGVRRRDITLPTRDTFAETVLGLR
jgi:glycosyltransferase involved in cell wall biosynthesis